MATRRCTRKPKDSLENLGPVLILPLPHWVAPPEGLACSSFIHSFNKQLLELLGARAVASTMAILEFSKILHIDGFTNQGKESRGSTATPVSGQGYLKVVEPFEAG